MTLKAKGRRFPVRKPLERAIEEGNVGRLKVRRQGFEIDGKAVVLARNHYPTGLKVLHRMVRPVVSEPHLKGLGTARQRQ